MAGATARAPLTHAAHVDAEHAVDLLVGERTDVALAGHDAGVEVGDVEAALGGQDALDGGRPRRGVGDVELDEAAADLGGHPLAGVDLHVGHHDPAPSAASRAAVAAPMPDAPPVTSATVPSKVAKVGAVMS